MILVKKTGNWRDKERIIAKQNEKEKRVKKTKYGTARTITGEIYDKQ